jgi:hypothetical protein
MALFWFVFGVGFALLAAAGGVTVRARLARTHGGIPRVDDAFVARIIEHGSVRVEDDDGLDLDAIADEEERFWSERWDEPAGEW